MKERLRELPIVESEVGGTDERDATTRRSVPLLHASIDESQLLRDAPFATTRRT